MSKKNTPGTPNTLFKYFARSPLTTVKSSQEDYSPSAKKLKEETPKSTKINLSKFDNSPSENVRLETPKTIKIKSTEEKNKKTEKDVDQTPKSTKNPKAKRKDFRESSDSDSEISSHKKRRRILVMESDSDEERDDNKNIKKESKKHEKAAPLSKSNINFKEKLTETPKENEISVDEVTIWPHNNFDFLKPEKIKDKNGRRPDHPNYDPSTLYVPEQFLNGVTPALKQWWDLKSNHYDCVLFFKVGKFYELYHMDADVGVKELGFTYMRGEFAHSGFPEVSYDKMATALIERGYKVARVEQTETPAMMVERCKKQRSVTKFDKTVKREVCQITNLGTQVYGAQSSITFKHQPNYMLAVAEKNLGTCSIYGICFIDTSIGDFFIGQFEDDKNCSRLLTLLSHYMPALVLTEKNGTSDRTNQILRTVLSNKLKESLNSDSQFWNAEKTLKVLAEKYFSNNERVIWPKLIKLMQDDSDHLGLTPNKNYNQGLKALGACLWYLTKCLLDEQILSMARFNIYTPPDIINDIKYEELIEKEEKKFVHANSDRFMVLDSITLSNLRITGEECSLLSILDNCCTKFGKRLLHSLICSPSLDIKIIRGRQSAITELILNVNLLQEIRSIFNKLPDFERHLAQIHGFGNGKRLKNHPDGRAILFEEKTYNQKKIQDFISILRGFETLTKIPDLFSEFESDLIVNLTQYKPRGLYPDLNEVLTYFKNAFNHDDALKNGVIAPEDGVDVEYDTAINEIKQLNSELKEYLIQQEKYFGCRLAYFGNDKKRFQIEVPENNARKADHRYMLEGQRKGSKPVRRFHTAETRDFLNRMIQAEENRNNILKDISRRIFEQFSNHYALWKRCVDSIAMLDVLGSLAEYARNQQEICVPEFIENTSKPLLEIEEGYHPCMNSETYIPNGIILGGDQASLLSLLTGPNMGGKSTLMRQVGLLVVMAQMGSHIAARKCKMSIVDRIFTRLGAQDDIMAGHSTFLVELNETSTILKHSTKNSLVLLDELGRGTATYDGTAIAASVVHFLADMKCRTLFSTHYHNLVDYFQTDERISLGHMACMVENESNDDPTQETVTFLYKYASGACPKSYGFNAAKLAGMPHSIIKRAHELSKKVESSALKKKIISKMLSNSDHLEIKDLLEKMHLCKVN